MGRVFSSVYLMAAIVSCALLATEARGAGYLFTGTDEEEFDQPSGNTSDRIGRFETSGASVVSGGIVTTTFHVNGMTVANGQLITGTVGASQTTAADGQTLRQVNFNGQQQNAYTADILTDAYNEDLGFDGTSIWHAHFGSASDGQIRQLDPNDLGGPALNVYNLDFGVVGLTFAEGDIWITDWQANRVGTWDPGLNVFTEVFTTPEDAGGLAYDPDDEVLWVGMRGGLVVPYDLSGQQLGPGFQPFGSIGDTIDGLAFSTEAVPEPGAFSLVAIGLFVLLGRGWRRQRNQR